jgi:hypothetical protein
MQARRTSNWEDSLWLETSDQIAIRIDGLHHETQESPGVSNDGDCSELKMKQYSDTRFEFSPSKWSSW